MTRQAKNQSGKGAAKVAPIRRIDSRRRERAGKMPRPRPYNTLRRWPDFVPVPVRLTATGLAYLALMDAPGAGGPSDARPEV